jgi:hypothetical protein
MPKKIRQTMRGVGGYSESPTAPIGAHSLTDFSEYPNFSPPQM